MSEITPETLDFTKKHWNQFSKKIGIRATFLFKVALTFIDEKKLTDEFLLFIQQLLKEHNHELLNKNNTKID